VDAGIGPRMRRRRAQDRLRFGQTPHQGEGQALVRQGRRLAGRDAQGRLVESLSAHVVARLIGHGALDRQDLPVRSLRVVGAREHVRRLLEASDVGERLAVGGEDGHVPGRPDGGLLQHGDRLGVLSLSPKHAGIIDRSGGVGRVLLVFAAERIRALPHRFCGDRPTERTGRGRRWPPETSAQRQGDQQGERRREADLLQWRQAHERGAPTTRLSMVR
jgi:hypothetical protein